MAVVCVIVIARPGGSSGVAPGIASASSPFDGATRADVPAPPLDLQDQSGRTATLGQFRGKPVIVTFLYTHCVDTCPITARTVASALDELGDRSVPVVAVSVDPPNDDAGSAQRFLSKNRLTGRMRFLLGDRARLAPIWKAYGVLPQGNGFEHSGTTVVLDGRGRQRVSFPHDKLTSDGLAHDVRVLQDQAGSGAAS